MPLDLPKAAAHEFAGEFSQARDPTKGPPGARPFTNAADRAGGAFGGRGQEFEISFAEHPNSNPPQVPLAKLKLKGRRRASGGRGEQLPAANAGKMCKGRIFRDEGG